MALVQSIEVNRHKLLLSVQTGEKSRDDALEAIKGNLDGFSRDAKMHPTPSAQSKKPGTVLTCSLLHDLTTFLLRLHQSLKGLRGTVAMPLH